MNNRFFFFSKYLVLILVIGLFTNTRNGLAQSYDSRQTVQKFATAMQIIRFAYVDSVNEAKLTETAITEMLKELDPHSVYISKEELREANEPLEGKFDGIGVQFQVFKDTILVVAAISGGPSEKVGIMAGDKIVKINGENAFGKKVNTKYVMDRLRGKKGTKVVVSIFRKGIKGLTSYTITRDKIPLNSIDATYMATSDIGYIKLDRFSQTSMDEFTLSLNTLKKAGMKSLILDLRNNTGGYMNIAIELADEFLEKGKLEVYTEGLKSPRQDFYSTQKGGFEKGKLIVMINEGSASASEIVAGAVQDWDRGLVIGRRSFGKGLVQHPFQLPDSTQIRLTTGRYHTPSGRCIQRPYEESLEDYYLDLYKRYKHGELVNADSIKFPDSLKYSTNNGRTVYGGGGIMPDIFIPWDSSFITKYYSEIFRKGIINQFVMQYIEDHRTDLKAAYPDLNNFSVNFVTDENFLKQFTDYAEKEGVKKLDSDFVISEKYISLVIKGLIARSLFDVGSYYQIVSPLDNELQKAILIIIDDNAFKKLKNKG
ncbi:MAG: S41 family peptidase [Lentimicrobiaceae bacterium]|nr:S41 family peptidase [Lentimicrobiaceae bacterium]